LTLVELIITLSILLIAVALGYLYLSYVSKSQDLALKQASIQQNVITAKNVIDKSLRYADRVKIGDDYDQAVAGMPDDNFEAFFMEEEDGNGIIMHRKRDGAEVPLLDSLAEGYNMRLSFRKVEPSFVEVSITCDINGENEYGITTQILIVGVDSFIGDSGSAIYIGWKS